VAGSSKNGDDAQRRWIEAERAGRCVEVTDDAMTPVLAQGARVVYDEEDEPIDAMEGALVVAWVQGKPVVRWFRRSGAFGLLKAENLEHSPSILLLDLNAAPHERRLRRVLWTSTPH
jgi:SOS-response transcriptional repressor LexA